MGPADWVDDIVESGEALALLSLCGRHTHASEVSLGGEPEIIRYAVRDNKTNPLGPCFNYETIAVFGCGWLGFAVAFRTLDGPASGRIVIAFRGVRFHDVDGQEDLEHANDVKCVARPILTHPYSYPLTMSVALPAAHSVSTRW